jgi:hypothetical protein
MNNINTTIFCLWLQGFLDANKESSLNPQKLEEVRNQLNDVITSIKEQESQQAKQQGFQPGQFTGQFPQMMRG